MQINAMSDNIARDRYSERRQQTSYCLTIARLKGCWDWSDSFEEETDTMHKPKIFLVGEDREHLITLEETGYVEEAVLQDYLVDYPDLLPGDQIDPENPRRWLLVAQEMEVPGEEDGVGRWSLDHLFLDQDGIPTFVECKRATDTRARREVVAQMLDYAANGTEYWSMDRLRQAAAETAERRGQSLDDEVARLVEGDEESIEAYWGTVETNLRQHKVRLVFVADSTPKELRRLVEFLNEEMANVEVLAVEVKQFQRESGKGQTALGPRVVGLTETAREKSSRPRKSFVTREEFLAECTPVGRKFFQRVLDLASDRGHVIYWGTTGFSVRAHLPDLNELGTFFYGYPCTAYNTDRDRVNIYFAYTNLFPPNSEKTAAFRQRLLDFGVFEQAGKWTLKAAVTDENLSLMNDIYDFVLESVEEFVSNKD
jgi:hypothetical protein